MSALGQKQTFWQLEAMSALPPKADKWFGLRWRWAARLRQQRQFAQDFVERQLREKRQGVLDHQPLLRCERLKFGLIARVSASPGA